MKYIDLERGGAYVLIGMGGLVSVFSLLFFLLGGGPSNSIIILPLSILGIISGIGLLRERKWGAVLSGIISLLLVTFLTWSFIVSIYGPSGGLGEFILVPMFGINIFLIFTFLYSMRILFQK